MATATWSTLLDHTSDAGFRAWGSELSANLAAIGLVQTADTGQINWSTVTRSGLSSDAGYEIWRFDDTLQATSPIYIKLLYGTAAAANARLGVQIGTGTNGAGLFTGYQNTVISYAAISSYTMSAVTQQTTPRSSYISRSNGFFGLVHKYAGYSNLGNMHTPFVIQRTTDTNGNPTANGVLLFAGEGTGYRFSTIRSIATASNTSTTTASIFGHCAVPNRQLYDTSTVTSASSPNPRAFINFSSTPDIQPLIGTCTVGASEIPIFSTFSTTLFGSTAHTYLGLATSNDYGAFPGEVSASSTFRCAMLWE